jgi:zinc/manganese transport system substrate-binding protein/zinc transport system substrate-binding protein
LPVLSQGWSRLELQGLAKGMDAQSALAPNPHIFLSPRLSSLMAANIARAFSELDPGGAEHYRARLALYQADMDLLSKAVSFFSSTRRGYSLVTSHGFFDYLAQDLGLLVLADIEPAPETAPSPARLSALASLIREERVAAIVLDPQADRGLARTLSAETGIPAALVDPATSGPADPPLDYYQRVIREDLQLLSGLFPVNSQGRPPETSPPGS